MIASLIAVIGEIDRNNRRCRDENQVKIKKITIKGIVRALFMC